MNRRKVIGFIAGVLLLASMCPACNQRFFSRKKISRDDSTQVEKSYHIVW